MAHWYHEVSVDWLKARQPYITATEIAKLVPEYKRTLKADPDAIAPGFAALWAEKNTVSNPDPVSVGAAARGHWMEWYAVDSWNQQKEPVMYHWDDCLIVSGRVGFSPDAMNVLQTLPEVELLAKDGMLIAGNGDYDIAPTEVMEIKSYEPARHIKSCIKEKGEHDELIQLATAFHVVEDLEKAHLVFFCPGAPISMKSFEYTRDDLKDEIELVGKIVERYAKTIKQCKELSSDMAAKYTESEIYKAMVEEVEMSRKDNILGF